MSKVYLAHDVILDRDVAIKVLNYDFANEEALKRRFMTRSTFRNKSYASAYCRYF